MNVAIAGLGYVGLSLAVLLAQHNKVTVVDVLPQKVELINRGVSPIRDSEIADYLAAGQPNLFASLDAESAYRNAELIIVAVPTSYDAEESSFDTHLVEDVIKLVMSVNPKAPVVIKSTVPVGFTRSLVERWPDGRFLYSPEFLREGHALHDNLYPERIVVGVPTESPHSGDLRETAETFAQLLREGAKKKDVPIRIVRGTEAEAIKLFTNTYLALRVAFFNELDTFAESCGLDARQIIETVGLDPRIGSHYNNPSFGYGGYCLPKDTKQLLANYESIPQDVIGAVVSANQTRKDFIAGEVVQRVEALVSNGVECPFVGVYRLVMKSGSDNIRESSVLDVVNRIQDKGIPVLVYEPMLDAVEYGGAEVTLDLEDFKLRSDVILANRWSDELVDVANKVYTRDLFGRD